MVGDQTNQDAATAASDDAFFGRMNDPSGAAAVRGLCGDEMEFYVVVREDRVEQVRYYTKGCGNTRSRPRRPCGSRRCTPARRSSAESAHEVHGRRRGPTLWTRAERARRKALSGRRGRGRAVYTSGSGTPFRVRGS
ncbi:MAG: iron-sulfur cluster assembly scaffold protein [Lentisphaerae bacterium]|nr:iron-sulfur cluster assembly scaffold protein [Lentisphaerota bacterium]